MTLPVPEVIRAANVADLSVVFPWDEWNEKQYYMGDPTDLLERLTGLTLRAATGLALACGEWICHRFSAVSYDPEPLQFLEAAWAGNIHLAYCEYTETDDGAWLGPVRAPLALVITIANDALFCLDEDPETAARAVWMYNLARHVLPRTDAFDAWFEAVVARLLPVYSRELDEERDLFATASPGTGAPVPREFYDLAFPLVPADAPALLDKFLRGLDPAWNPFLHTPATVGDANEPPSRPCRYP